MRFINPSGLWLLLLIPVLIIIYIIRARYEARSVSSTFIWKLSTRFMKKQLPFRRIRQLLLFISQLLMIVAVSMLVSRPAIVSQGGGTEYILIIDGSASMNRENANGETRFDRAIEQIRDMIPKADFGTPFTIILAADEAGCLVERSQSEDEIRLALKYAKCGNGDGSLTDALELTRAICKKNPVTDVILFSDCEYETSENIEVINLAEDEWNVFFSELSYEKKDEDYVFTATLNSQNADAEIATALSVDGKIIDVQNVGCWADKSLKVTFTAKKLKNFEVATVYTDAKDALDEDNSYSICKKDSAKIKVMLVGSTTFYLENVLKVLGNCTITKADSLSESSMSGYGLYIFDGCMPETLPDDGSVWIFSPEELPTDMSMKEGVSSKAQLRLAKKGNSTLYSSLADQLKLDGAAVSKYSKISAGRSWESLLSCGEDTVLFTRRENNGMRTAVFAFDLHDSNLPLLSDYVILMKELLAYSVPEILMDTDFSVSETINLTVLPLAEQFYMEYPNKNVVSLSVRKPSIEVVPENVGVYTANQTLSDGTTKSIDFFVHIPFSEMKDEPAVSSVSLELPSVSDSNAIVAEDGFHEIWIWVLLALLVLILAEWGLYYYEQF